MAELTVAEIKAAVHEVIEEQRQNFWVEPERHYLHHKQLDECLVGKAEWQANHDFISDVRGMGKTVRKTGLIVAASTFIGYLIKVLFLKS